MGQCCARPKRRALDGVTDLPQDILHCILSFAEIHEAYWISLANKALYRSSLSFFRLHNPFGDGPTIVRRVQGVASYGYDYEHTLITKPVSTPWENGMHLMEHDLRVPTSIVHPLALPLRCPGSTWDLVTQDDRAHVCLQLKRPRFRVKRSPRRIYVLFITRSSGKYTYVGQAENYIRGYSPLLPACPNGCTLVKFHPTILSCDLQSSKYTATMYFLKPLSSTKTFEIHWPISDVYPTDLYRIMRHRTRICMEDVAVPWDEDFYSWRPIVPDSKYMAQRRVDIAGDRVYKKVPYMFRTRLRVSVLLQNGQASWSWKAWPYYNGTRYELNVHEISVATPCDAEYLRGSVTYTQWNLDLANQDDYYTHNVIGIARDGWAKLHAESYSPLNNYVCQLQVKRDTISGLTFQTVGNARNVLIPGYELCFDEITVTLDAMVRV